MKFNRFKTQHSNRRSSLGPLPKKYFDEYQLNDLFAPINIQINHHLDIGTGTGRILENLIKLFNPKNITAVDPNLNLINLISTKNVKLVQEDFMEVELSNKFDLITCIGVLMHIPNQLEALKKIKTLLAPNGIALMWVYKSLTPPIQLIISILRKLIFSLKLKGTLISDITSYFLHIPIFRVSKTVKNLTNKDFKEVKLVIYDQLNADFVKYYKMDELRELIIKSGFKRFKIIETGNKGFSVILEND